MGSFTTNHRPHHTTMLCSITHRRSHHITDRRTPHHSIEDVYMNIESASTSQHHFTNLPTNDRNFSPVRGSCILFELPCQWIRWPLSFRPGTVKAPRFAARSPKRVTLEEPSGAMSSKLIAFLLLVRRTLVTLASLATSSFIVTTSKALVTRSDALVPSSEHCS